MILRSAASFTLAACLLALTVTPSDAAGVAWSRDLKKAAGESKRTGKPILMQVTAGWCGYCHKMLRETFPDEKLASHINECFIPVVLDADENEEIVEAIGITAFPSTIIISPNMDVVGRVRGFHTARSLEKKLAPFCNENRHASTLAANTIVKAKPVSGSLTPAPETRSQPLTTASISSPSERTAEQLATQKPAFAGFCLVSMLNERKRIEGHGEHSTEFHNHRLEFASDRHLAEFQASPEKFWPLLDGRCPVSKARGEEDPTGDPQTVAVFRGQLVFFKDLAHRADFAKNPRGYLEEAAIAGKREQPVGVD